MLINFYDQVPRVYTNSSRDFQYLSWLINIVLNSVKHNVDDLYELPNAAHDPKLTELLAITLGFKIKRNYDQKQLAALVSVFPSLLRYKGTEKAITIAAEALINASGTTGNFMYTINNSELEIVLPNELVDITLFIDLLPYILPAGMTCKVLRKTQIQRKLTTEIKYLHKGTISSENDTELAKLFAVPDSDETTDDDKSPEFAFHKQNDEKALDADLLNAGLLDMTVIPTLINPIEKTEEPTV